MRSDEGLRYLELFAGVGGFRAAIERATKSCGMDSTCVGFSEIDPHAVKTYRANFKVSDAELDLGDINALDSEKKIKALPSFDFLLAGFPCQPFSLMGEKGGFNDTRGTLFFQIAKILAAKRPPFFILENVRGLKTHDGGRTYDRIMEILTDELGYSVRTELLNSADFGVPQVRRRLYFVGVRDRGLFRKIEGLDFQGKSRRRYPTTWHLLEREVDDKYFLSERILKTILEHGSGNYYSKSEINRLLARPLTASMHKMHRANQDNYYSEDFIYGEYDSGEVRKLPRGGKRVRRLTPTEAFRLQGFPDSFVRRAKTAGVSDSQLYRQAGNAITVNVAEQVLKRMLEVVR
jgi:DNA (cytosine-5)-methyltransferase 1